MSKKTSLSERLKIAGQLAVRAKIFYDLWRFYSDALEDEKGHYTMNLYTEYFRFDIHAHFLSFVVSTSALLEPREDTINLSQLVNETLDVAAISDADRTEILALLSKVDEMRKPVMILRSDVFAHRSASLSYNDAFKKASVTPNQLRELAANILKITNRLLFVSDLRDNISNMMPVSDAREILDVLYRQHCAV